MDIEAEIWLAREMRLKIYFLITILVLSTLIGIVNVNGSSNVVRDEFGNIYNSIGEAIESVPPGSEIVVEGGVYKERLIINKSIKLIGVDYPTIDADLFGTNIMIQNVENVYIEGFKIINSGRAYSTEDAGIRIDNAKNVAIINNVFDNIFFGILIKESYNVTIENNSFTGIEEYYISDRQHGIYTWYSRKVFVRNNVFTSVKDGIYNDHNYDSVIENNLFMGGRYGIHLMYSANYTIRNNTITQFIAGMALMYSQNITVRYNKIIFNRVGGIGEGIFMPECDDIFVEYNWIVGNVFGLNIRYLPYTPGELAVIRYNVIAFNYIGISFDPDSSAYIYGNDFIENIQNVRYIGFKPSRTKWYNESMKLGNYWSDISTYDVDEDGTVDLPYTGSDPLYKYFTTHRELSIFYYSPSYYILSILFKYAFTTRFEGVVLDLYPSKKPINVDDLGLILYTENIVYPIIYTILPIGIYYYGVKHVRGKKRR